MKDDEFEKMLSSVISEDVKPPEELVLKTESRIKKKDNIILGIVSGIAVNVVGIFLFIFLLITLNISFIYKAAICFGAINLFNLILLCVIIFVQNRFDLIEDLWRDKKYE